MDDVLISLMRELFHSGCSFTTKDLVVTINDDITNDCITIIPVAEYLYISCPSISICINSNDITYFSRVDNMLHIHMKSGISHVIKLK